MKFKDDVIQARFEDMAALAKTIATDMDEWSQKNHGIELTITATTSTSAEDKALGRLSDTHRTRRAWDIRTRGLEEDFLNELIAYTNKKYGKYGAVVMAIPKLIIDKSETSSPHLHCQLSRKYALKELSYGTN